MRITLTPPYPPNATIRLALVYKLLIFPKYFEDSDYEQTAIYTKTFSTAYMFDWNLFTVLGGGVKQLKYYNAD